jgi:predicted nucleic acid-binding protein
VARLRRRVGGRLVLDAEGIVKLADGDRLTLERARAAWRRDSEVMTVASALAEVLRGGPRDAKVHRVLKQITVVPVDKRVGRTAGELLGQVGLTGHKHALDALLAAVALGQPRPVLLLTSDPEDLRRLTDEPGRPRAERIAVIRV